MRITEEILTDLIVGLMVSGLTENPVDDPMVLYPSYTGNGLRHVLQPDAPGDRNKLVVETNNGRAFEISVQQIAGL